MTTSAPSVHNHKNVYILGAGFSAQAGMPLLHNFLERMRDASRAMSDRPRDRDAIASVLAFRHRAAAAAYRVKIDVENVEELFSLAAAGLGDRLTEDVQRAIAATLDFCSQQAKPPQWRIAVNSEEPPPAVPPAWIDAFSKVQNEKWRGTDVPAYEVVAAIMAGSLGQHRCEDSAIVTFNYDLVVENALRGTRIPFHYGFSLPAEDPDSLVFYGGVPLLKLHGSVNWYPRDERILVRNSYSPDLEKAPLLVPPSYRKNLGGILEDVWKRALQAIRDATRIVIIGFSMPPTDTHFKYLLAEGLRDNISLRSITFVNPRANSKELLDQIKGVLRDELFDKGIVRPIARDTLHFFQNRGQLESMDRPVGASITVNA